MPQRKVTDLPELAETPASGDIFLLVDVSDTSESAQGTSKKVTRTNVVGGLAAQADFTVEHNANGTHKKVTNLDNDVAISQKNAGGTAQPLIKRDSANKTTIYDGNGNEQLELPTTASAVNHLKATPSATGSPVVVEPTGDDTNIGLDIKPKGTGAVRKPSSASVQVVAGATDLLTGDGKFYLAIPPELNGMNLTGIFDAVVTAGTTNTTDVQLARIRSGVAVDMLSTKLTIDSGETDSSTAATPAVINAANDDVQTNDLIRVDIDQVSTTAPKGLILRLTFGF